MAETITLYKAVAEMRRLTKEKKTFSFTHATYDRDRKRIVKGVSVVHKASLRSAAKDADVKDADYKLFYFNHDVEENRNCWQCLIMYFNEMKVELQ